MLPNFSCSLVSKIFFVLAFTSFWAWAAEIKVSVIDPDSRPVAGAQVRLLRGSSIVATQSTTASGEAKFEDISHRELRVEVLAPGFAPATKAIAAGEQNLVVKLGVAAPAQQVVVTAARTPVPLEEAGISETVLTADQLVSKQPTSASEALRFLPGAIVAASGQRGGITSLFVRGGDSRYNKVIVDGVAVNDAGGTFDFGVAPLAGVDRLEFVRGAESALYGSDAMTSVVQLWTGTGHSRMPEMIFGADGGNYGSAHGYADVAGARGRFDYNFFGDQFNTAGQSANDDYSNSLEGANLGVLLTPQASFRLRLRHSSGRTGVPGEWNFNGVPFLAPDADQFARNNDFLASGEFNIAAPSRWQHRIGGYEYNHRRFNLDAISDRDCFNFFIDCPFLNQFNFDRAAFAYQGEYTPRSWTHTIFGYEFEDENGFVRENFTGERSDPGDSVHGLRRNHALYGEQFFSYRRLSFVGGLRYVHNESFGEKVVPHAALTFLARRGGNSLGATRLRFGYGTGIKEPRFEESFGIGRFIDPNPNLKPEENRSLEGGVEQGFAENRYSLSAIYFNNLFTNQIAFQVINPLTFESKYLNLNRALAHGAELELKARPASRVNLSAGYTYTSTQVLRSNSCDPLFSPLTCPGSALIRRPRHAGSLLATYTAPRWGGSLGGTFIGRRPDSDFLFCAVLGCSVPTQDHTAGYARLDLGGWRQLNHFVTAYANLENLLNKHYEDVPGYPAPRLNIRAGLRFRVGGE